MTITEIVSVIAIIAGPAFGAWLTRRLDDKREAYKRKFDVFRALMRTEKCRFTLTMLVL